MSEHEVDDAERASPRSREHQQLVALGPGANEHAEAEHEERLASPVHTWTGSRRLVVVYNSATREVSMARDIYTEPEGFDLDTLRNLGPLTPLAGTWEGQGVDTHPVAEGIEDEPYRERVIFEPIDPQPNGPQLLYGLRYHIHINKLDEPLTFHDQVGYWLWEPATYTVFQTLAIPRGQVAMAMGTAQPDARRFTVKATLGSPVAGIVSAPFLHENSLRTIEYSITITVNEDGTLLYEQDTVLQVAGRPEPFHHTDRNLLRRTAAPQPNPALLADAAAGR